MAGKIQVGQQLSPFKLKNQDGNPLNLTDLLGKSILVLFFYPWDFTKVCTAEACGFRDRESDFSALGAQVVGISSNGVKSHHDFAKAHRLNYPLLTDTNGKIRRKLGLGMLGGLVPGRYTLVVDLKGVVRHISSNLTEADPHIEEALKTVQSLQKKKS